MSYLNLKQLRKLLSEAGRKKRSISGVMVGKSQYAIDLFFFPLLLLHPEFQGGCVKLKHNQAPLRTHLTHNVLLQMFFSSVAECYSDVHTVCWQTVQSDVEIRGGVTDCGPSVEAVFSLIRAK